MFLVTPTRTHAKQTHAFSTTSCYSREIGSLWQRSAGLGCGGFSWSSRIGVLSATLHLPVSLAIQFLRVFNLYLVQATGTGILTDLLPNGSPCFLPRRYCYAWCLCPLLPLLSLPTTHPTWASLGLLIADASGVLKQIVCPSTLHCDKSMPPNWLLGGTAASCMLFVCSEDSPRLFQS